MKWFYKRKINNLAIKAKAYMDVYYEQPVRPPSIQHSISVVGPKEKPEEKPQESKNKFSREPDESPRYSLDRYDSETIEEVLRSMYSEAKPQAVVRSLEASVDMSFADKMMDLIDSKDLRVVDVYKAAQIDRRLFSKIISDRNYKPSKETCVALALALQLSLDEANDLLSRAGYVLSHSSRMDVVLEFFFKEGIYNLDDVNAVLYQLFFRTLSRKTSY